MHNKDVCSPSSQSGFGVHLNSNAGAFASLYSVLTNELSGNYSNGGGASASLYPYSDSGTDYDSCVNVIQKHQDMVNRHSMCLSRLVETSKEVEALQQENGQLRVVNKELQKNLNLLVQASLENRFGGGDSSIQTHSIPFDALHSFRYLNLCDGKENCADWNTNNINHNNKELLEASDESPTSVIDNNGVETERFSLPKSISVRSNGYLNIAQPPAVVTNNNACRAPSSTENNIHNREGEKSMKEFMTRTGAEYLPWTTTSLSPSPRFTILPLQSPPCTAHRLCRKQEEAGLFLHYYFGNGSI